MKIEFIYTTDHSAHMEMDADALRTLEAAIIDDIKGADVSDDHLTALCLCVTEIVHALDRIAEVAKAEKETTE